MRGLSTGLAVLAALAAAPLSHAETFDERLALARKLEESAEYKAWHKEMMQHVGAHIRATMESCVKGVAGPDLASFVLITDVSREGRPLSIEVRPRTGVSNCFATGFATAPFPTPPGFGKRQGFPLFFEFDIQRELKPGEKSA